MTCAALQLTYCTTLASLGGNDLCEGDSCVIEFPRCRRPHRGAVVATAGGGRGVGRGDRGGHRAARPSARVILWPWPYSPRRSEDCDAADAQVWMLFCAGLLSETETSRRDGELRRMRGSLASIREEQGRLR
jgi:hypothetical protein